MTPNLHEIPLSTWQQLLAADAELSREQAMLVIRLRALATILTTARAKALRLLVAAPLLYRPSEHPCNEHGCVRHDVLRRLAELGLAQPTEPDDTGVFGYRATDLAVAVAQVLPKRKRKPRRGRKAKRAEVTP